MSKITPIAKTLEGKTNFSPARLAEEKGMNYMSAMLKDGTCAKVLSNSQEVDVLIMKNGKVISAEGYVNDEKSTNRIAKMFQKLAQQIDQSVPQSDDAAHLLAIV